MLVRTPSLRGSGGGLLVGQLYVSNFESEMLGRPYAYILKEDHSFRIQESEVSYSHEDLSTAWLGRDRESSSARFGSTAITPKALGNVEATISLCSRVDSQSADKYKEWGKLLVRDMPEKELAEMRDSNEYKENYDSLSAELEKLSKEKAVAACRTSLKESKK